LGGQSFGGILEHDTEDLNASLVHAQHKIIA